MVPLGNRLTHTDHPLDTLHQQLSAAYILLRNCRTHFCTSCIFRSILIAPHICEGHTNMNLYKLHRQLDRIPYHTTRSYLRCHKPCSQLNAPSRCSSVHHDLEIELTPLKCIRHQIRPALRKRVSHEFKESLKLALLREICCKIRTLKIAAFPRGHQIFSSVLLPARTTH